MSPLDKIHQLPVYKKAELLFQLVHSLVASFPDEDHFIQDTKNLMLEAAMTIPTKIAGAEGGDLFSLRMQNAAIIREHAMNLQVLLGSLRFHEEYKALEYIAIIRNEIEAFRLLFIEWIKGFDTSNHYWDSWELFNPPGAIQPLENNLDEDSFDLSDFLDFDDDDDF